MDKDHWRYDNIISEEVNISEDNREEPGVFKNIDCFDAFNISHILTLYFVKVSK